MAEYTAAERRTLDAGVEKLRPSLNARGFEYSTGDHAVSSGGPFAVGFFRRGDIEIGLIVRSKTALGCPNYSAGHGYAGHEDLISALGADGRQDLVSGEWPSFQSRGGGDPFDALRHDLEHIILPAFDESEVRFRASLARACERARERFKRNWGSSDDQANTGD
jgi:hypothetical protein